MSEPVYLMGLFTDPNEAAKTIDEFYNRGLTDESITVMTGVPYPEQAIGRHREWDRLPYIVLGGALAGLLFGLFLSVITPLLYPLNVGGNPLVAGPPAAIITYVCTMMATIVSTFLGVIWEMGFPSFAKKRYHKLVTAGYVAVMLECEESMEEELVAIFETQGGQHIHRPEKKDL